jgi:hypothetical protein
MAPETWIFIEAILTCFKALRPISRLPIIS